MRIALRGQTEVAIEIGRAQPAPVDWDRWRDALLAGAPLAPPIEHYTIPEGWSVTLAEVATASGVRVHAFYSILDRAVHATADVAPAQREHVRKALLEAVPVFDDEIVSLADL